MRGGHRQDDAVKRRGIAAARPLLKPARMSSRRMCAALAVAAALSVAGAPRTSFGAGDQRISGIAAGARTLFALRGNTVVAFDASGRESARCGHFEASPPTRTPGPVARTVDAEEALRLAGLPDDDTDSAEAEDVLDDEGLTAKRRSRPSAEAAIIPHAVAASPAADEVWIATSAGLYRGRGGSCGRVALAQRDVVAVAAAPNAIAAATEQLLWRSDGRGPLRVAAGLTGRPRALAVVDEQRTLVATDDAIVEIGPYGVARAVLDRGADALAVCDGMAIALAGDGAWTWTADGDAIRLGDRPPARTIACGDPRLARFVATGDSVYTSLDGVTWQERRAWPGRSIAGAGALGDRIWIAVDDAVVPLDGAPPPPPGPPRPPPALAPAPGLPALATARLTNPVFPWPHVTLVFTGQRTPLRDGWSLVVLVGFHLGRGPAAAADRRHLAAELVRRDAELAAQELELAASTATDPSAGARLRALRQEREALR
jgi:hypothetical protein